MCPITTAIKTYKSIINKTYKTKQYDKIVLLARDKLNSIEVLISKALTDSYLRHGEFVIVHNVSKESDDMKD